MTHSRGDVLIAYFPHADGSGSKPRPVLVIQSDVYNVKMTNMVVAEITSKLGYASDPASLLINVRTQDGRASGLLRNSVVSCVNLATIDEALVAKKVGRLTHALMKRVDSCLKIALELP